jgi:hypothetical protein
MKFGVALATAVLPLLLVVPARGALFDYNGYWKGTIVFDRSAPSAPPDSVKSAVYMFSIHDGDIEVTVDEPADGKLYTFCDSGCLFKQRASNAAIVGIARSTPGDDGKYWVESWTFNCTMKDSDHVLVEFTRVVRNIGTDTSDKNFQPEFAERGEGVFERGVTSMQSPQPQKPGGS